ncbi:MAG: MMPL family transporter [Actinomycetota bacterium]
MFTRIGAFTVRRRRSVLILSLVGLVIAAVLGGGLFDRLLSGGFDDPGAESTQAAEYLDEEFGTGAPDLVLLVTAESGSVDEPDVVAEGLEITAELAAIEGTDDVISYWSAGSPPPLASEDGSRAMVLLRFLGEDDDPDRVDLVGDVLEEYEGERGPVVLSPAGFEAVFEEVGSTIEGDLARAEAIAIPLTLILLIVVFGGIVAALLPVAVGAAAVFGAFLVLFLITGFTDVSIFSLNLVTALGLGLAIDYSLFIVSRYREELARGRSTDEAVIRAVETAGRTVAFSALTVAVSLSALLIFPLYFLRSFAYAGIGVIIVAMVTSVISLPALLAVLGERVNKWQVFKRRDPIGGEGIWHRIAVGVMRRPVTVAATGIVVLLAAGIPFFGVEFGVPDDRVLPDDNPARIASDILRDEFTSAESDAFPIVAVGNVDDATVTAYASDVSTLDGVARVDAVNGRYVDGALVAPADETTARFAGDDDTWFNVVPDVEPISPEAEDLIAEIRALETGFDETLVGGNSAALVDSKDAIFGLVPIAAGIIGLATFVLLFLMFGSLLVPLKAIVLNTLSLTATFGLMVWVFQDGNGAGLLDFTATGLTDTTTPILMFCIAFGLSMDYEVFLLSRIKEEHDRTGDNDLAVATGLEKTGRLVTAAALLLSITFFAFATSGVTFIKLFGLGLAVAVLVDAFIVRATLVPALMKLAGEWNWWAPAPLRRIHDRFGLSEAGPPEEPPAERPLAGVGGEQ